MAWSRARSVYVAAGLGRFVNHHMGGSLTLRVSGYHFANHRHASSSIQNTQHVKSEPRLVASWAVMATQVSAALAIHHKKKKRRQKSITRAQGSPVQVEAEADARDCVVSLGGIKALPAAGPPHRAPSGTRVWSVVRVQRAVRALSLRYRLESREGGRRARALFYATGRVRGWRRELVLSYSCIGACTDESDNRLDAEQHPIYESRRESLSLPRCA